MNTSLLLNIHWSTALGLAIPVLIIVYSKKDYSPESKSTWIALICYYVTCVILTASYLVHFVLRWSSETGEKAPAVGCGLMLLLGLFYSFLTKRIFWS